MAKLRLCSIPECGKKHEAKGFCTSHYTKFRLHGDPLFKKKRGPKKTKTYFLSVVIPYEGKDCLYWPFSLDKDGYGKLGSGRVHREVCKHVYGAAPSKRHEAAHSCGNRACVNRNHLRWATPSENRKDKLMHGTDNRGEKHSLAKLTEIQVREIIDIKGKAPVNDVALMYDISSDHVYSIQSRRAWSWLDV